MLGEQIIASSFWLAINIFFEARGEDFMGKVYVAHVTLNRSYQRGIPVKDVVFAKNQFSWTRDDDPQMRAIVDMLHDSPVKAVLEHMLAQYADVFIECCKAAQQAISEQVDGENLSKANHYFNPNVVLPSWASKMKHVKTHGNHSFYYDKNYRKV